jgi:hypothetical protein
VGCVGKVMDLLIDLGRCLIMARGCLVGVNYPFSRPFSRHCWGTGSPTFESLRNAKNNFLVL